MVRPMRIIAAQADGDAEPYWPFIANQVAHGSRVHTGKWAFAVKYENGAVKEFRARWVLRGFTMVYGQDYDDTFIGGVNCTTSRCLFRSRRSYTRRCS